MNLILTHFRCQKLGITHLCFVDDLLLFAGGNVRSVQLLKDAFEMFSGASGLKANLTKGQVFFGGGTWRQRSIYLLS